MYLGVLLLIILFINTKMQSWACLVLRLVTASEHHVPLPCAVGKLSRCKGRCRAHPNAHYYYYYYHHHHHHHHPNVEVYL
jgi:hypothetical protein